MVKPERKLVLFDDDEDIVGILTYILQEKGWLVYSFTDCNDVEQRVSEILPDVILMDNWIPESGGIIATQKLKANPNLVEIPVIYFSANNDIKGLSREAGADGFLAKPFDLDELDTLFQDLFGSST